MLGAWYERHFRHLSAWLLTSTKSQPKPACNILSHSFADRAATLFLRYRPSSQICILILLRRLVTDPLLSSSIFWFLFKTKDARLRLVSMANQLSFLYLAKPSCPKQGSRIMSLYFGSWNKMKHVASPTHKACKSHNIEDVAVACFAFLCSKPEFHPDQVVCMSQGKPRNALSVSTNLKTGSLLVWSSVLRKEINGNFYTNCALQYIPQPWKCTEVCMQIHHGMYCWMISEFHDFNPPLHWQ